MLLTEIEDNEDLEACAGLYRGALRAIRPQLVGEIAAAADRVLAQGQEAVRWAALSDQDKVETFSSLVEAMEKQKLRLNET